MRRLTFLPVMLAFATTLSCDSDRIVAVEARPLMLPAGVSPGSVRVDPWSAVDRVLPGDTLITPVAVVVSYSDAAGSHRIANADVEWSTTSGTVSPLVTQTDSFGLARTTWRVGQQIGPVWVTGTVKVGTETRSTSQRTVIVDPASLRIRYVGGNEQVADSLGAAVNRPLVVQVFDHSGVAVANAPVRWTLRHGNGQLSIARPDGRTDSFGDSQAMWRLGTTADTVDASVALGSPSDSQRVTFVAEPVGTLRLIKVSGDFQVGRGNTAIAQPFVVQVVDSARHGAPVAGVRLTWTSTLGAIALQLDSVTNAQGIGRAVWMLPACQNLTVTASLVPPIRADGASAPFFPPATAASFTAATIKLELSRLSLTASYGAVTGELPLEVNARSLCLHWALTCAVPSWFRHHAGRLSVQPSTSSLPRRATPLRARASLRSVRATLDSWRRRLRSPERLRIR